MGIEILMCFCLEVLEILVVSLLLDALVRVYQVFFALVQQGVFAFVH